MVNSQPQDTPESDRTPGPVDHAARLNTLNKFEAAIELPKVLGFTPHWTLCHPNEKIPFTTRWQEVPPTLALLARHLNPELNGAAAELGIATGPVSNWLIRGDYDQPETARSATLLMPPSGMVSGRPLSPASAVWYQVVSHTDAVARKIQLDFKGLSARTLPNDEPRRTKLGELLTRGQQSLIPTSGHKDDPGGYRWETLIGPARVDGEETAMRFRSTCVAGLLAIYAPGQGERHEFDLALQGFFATYSDWSAEWIGEVIRAVAFASGRDEEWQRRGKPDDIARTIALVTAGEEATGRLTLIRLLGEAGEAIVRAIRDFLGWGHAVRGTGARRPDRPRIDTRDLLYQQVDQCLDAFAQANDPARGTPANYVRGEVLAQVALTDQGKAAIKSMAPVGVAVACDRVMEFGHWVPTDAGPRWIYEQPPRDVIRGMMEQPTLPNRMPPLRGLTAMPCMRPDGTVLMSPGYDTATGLFYLPEEDAPAIPAVSENPSDAEITDAFRTLHEPFVDFPFVSPSDEANALALLVTVALRATLPDPIPLALVDAPDAGSGKGLLVDVIAIIALGSKVGGLTEVTDDAEWRKKITTELLTGDPLHVVDNVDSTLRSGQLAALMTLPVWKDRVLGVNQQVAIPKSEHGVWAATGNNLMVGGDMARRCYQIRIDPKTPKPYLRPDSDFTHTPLDAWVLEQRPALLHALLTICRAWYARGKPMVGAPPLGSFERWAKTIWGVLSLDPTRARGEEGEERPLGTFFLGNGKGWYEQGDIEGEEYEAFLRALAVSFGVTPFAAADVARKVKIDSYSGYAEDSALAQALPSALATYTRSGNLGHRIGLSFRQHRNKRYGDRNLRIEVYRQDGHRKSSLWCVRQNSRTRPDGVVQPDEPDEPETVQWATAEPQATVHSGPPDAIF